MFNWMNMLKAQDSSEDPGLVTRFKLKIINFLLFGN